MRGEGAFRNAGRRVGKAATNIREAITSTYAIAFCFADSISASFCASFASSSLMRISLEALLKPPPLLGRKVWALALALAEPVGGVRCSALVACGVGGGAAGSLGEATVSVGVEGSGQVLELSEPTFAEAAARVAAESAAGGVEPGLDCAFALAAIWA